MLHVLLLLIFHRNENNIKKKSEFPFILYFRILFVDILNDWLGICMHVSQNSFVSFEYIYNFFFPLLISVLFFFLLQHKVNYREIQEGNFKYTKHMVTSRD